MIKKFFRIGSASILFGAGLLASSCFESTQKEDVELTLNNLNNVPGGVDSVRITLVEFTDTSIVYQTLWDEASIPTSPFRAPLGSAKGHDWLVKVEGYRNGYLVYHVLIPSDVTNVPLQLDVSGGWPAVVFASAVPDTTGSPDTVKFMTNFRSVPAGTHWHMNYTPTQYDIAYASGLNVPTTRLQRRTWITADLHVNGTHALLPVQLPDTMLVDEALSPAGSSVRITEAYLDVSDTVHLMLALGNFVIPAVDSAFPGEGLPMLHDKRGLRLIPSFHNVAGDISHLIGPAADLDGVDTLVVALHYAIGIRIRPPVQDELPTVSALRLRSAIPTLSISGHWINAADTNLLDVSLTRGNYSGFHTHFYRNVFGDPQYITCDLGQCSVPSRVWRGATAIVVAVHIDGSHNPLIPLVLDTLSLP